MGIPPAKPTDGEDVAWGLQTADALWKRGERIDALVWLRRAAQAAAETSDDDRAVELARGAAELAEYLASQPAIETIIPKADGNAQILELDAGRMSIEVEIDDGDARPAHMPSAPAGPPVASLVTAPPALIALPVEGESTSLDAVPAGSAAAVVLDRESSGSVLPAERVHAGLYDPWADASAPKPAPVEGSLLRSADDLIEDEEVVTSLRGHDVARATGSSSARIEAARPAPSAPVPAKAPARPPPLPPRAKPPLPPQAPRPLASSPALPRPATSPGHVVSPAPGLPSGRPSAPAAPRPSSPSSPSARPPSAPAFARPPSAPALPSAPPRAPSAPALPSEPPRPPSAPALPSEPPRPPSAPAILETANDAAVDVEAAPEGNGLDLEDVESFADLPDDARVAFARAARVDVLQEGEEVSTFALAYVLEGAFDVAATMVDAPSVRLAQGAVQRARGTTEHVIPMRLISADGRGVVATWSDAEVTEAFRTCPWVEEDLRVAADRVLTLVGITIGPLGERLDASIREQIMGRLTMRPLVAGEVVVAAGAPVPGLLLVGVGDVELVNASDEVLGVIGSGEFLFPTEVLGAGEAPSTARAGAGGALVMFGDRRVAQELLVTCPPLLEVFAGM